MATNGNNSGGGQISYSSNGTPNMGISGNLQNRVAGNAYSERFYREDSGYLDSTKSQIEAMLKYYNEIASLTKDLSKVEQNRFNKQQKALEEQLKTLQYVKETRSVDFEESIKLIRESNRLLISGQKAYKDVLESTQDSQSEADKEHLGNLEQALIYMNKVKEVADDTNKDMKDTAKTLNNSSADFGKSLSNTLKNAADFTANLSNMLNLQSMANNAAEQSARSKLSARNAVMKQLGMTSDSQYNQFNKSLVNELQTMNSQMGSLFSADDMYAYFEKMDKLGITNQKMAEEQMKATVMGTKYLGVSDETQQAIFKFMRTTNDYTMLDKHNKTIAGLLKSQLGVSKDQLDIMSRTVYSDADVLAALGGNAKKYTTQAIAAGAAVDSAMGVSGMGDVLTRTLGQIVTAAPQDLGKWAQIFGSDIQAIRQYGQAGEAGKAIELMINNNQLKNIAGMNSDAIAGLMSELGIEAGLININRYFKENGTASYNEKLTTSLANIESMTDTELAKYLEDTTELTWLEKLSNDTSLIYEELLGYKGTMNLAHIAFGLYIASGAAKIFGGIANFIGGWKTGGGLSAGLQSLLGLGKGGSANTLSGLLGASGPLALSIAGVAAAVGVVAVAAKAIANKNNENARNYSSATGNLYNEYTTNGGMNNVDATVAAMNKAQSTNKGGFFSNQYGNYTAFDDNGVYSGMAISADRSPTDMMQAFYMEDSAIREKYLGSAVSALKGGDAEARKALDNAIKTYDGEAYNKIKAFALNKMLQSSSLSDNYLKSQLMGAIMVAAYYQGVLGRSELSNAFADANGFNFNAWSTSAEGIKQYLAAAGITDVSQLSKYYALMDSYDAYFMLNDGSFLGYPNSREQLNNAATDFSLNGYHKAGKHFIPKDNYRALLHKGEMVLNAREAAALREYMGLGAYGYGGQSDNTPRPKGKIVDTWPWPMTAGYPSYPSGNQHRGLDFGIPIGTKVGAVVDGTIITAYTGDNYNTYASGKRVFGQYILMKGNNGLYYRYGHLSKVGVSNNQQVKAGQTIGLSGNTGYSTGPHLHFQVQTGTANNTDIYPYNYVTNGLFQTTGSIGTVPTSQGSNIEGETANIEPSTRRFIPGASVVQNTGGMGGVTDNGTTKIVSSVDGGFNKLISYLESISKRQDEQQILLETFSKSRASGPDF